ncbi:S1C family serine protease [Metabacillus halosaccharovorans]|uniref:S1C family serine protease n=1 Tax=Metabacillus halosaccharovorans TaxID=930124 RepID=UPI001C201480|nr:trypsin-like peptidase domain-containing protein [Metabacillus halosaccharovorans]MBU7593185.1 trypsin-like serine protease [Metabacillus halosaccharovorans]
MKKRMISSILISLLIWIAGGIGFFYVKEYTAKKVYSESTILNQNKDVNVVQPPLEIKEIIREAQKKVVMVELEDGTVGSGFLYNHKGDIITNAHVISGAKQVKIRTTDAMGFDGEVIGISTETDVAVVRVSGLENVEPLKLAPNTSLELGDEILALGSPLGFQNTVTTGIISGTDRELDVEPYKYDDVYQISAPIAPGNSGGPLIDRRTGSVVGINSARIEQGSIGFSLPIGTVLPLVNSWSETPMKNLPVVEAVDEVEEIDENKIIETADYLVSYFIDSINYQDFVTAYSLLGSNWQTNIDYQSFRNDYLNIISIRVDELKTTKIEDRVLVETVLTVTEQTDQGHKSISKKMNYVVAYENDQAKIISEDQHE